MPEAPIEKQGQQELMQHLPQQGRVEWLSYRPEKRAPVKVVDEIEILEGGICGDHYAGGSGRRSITLIQHEHLPAIAGFLHRDTVDPADLRRNIVVSGINLLALKDREFKIGTVILKMTGLCHPCSRMDDVLGEGGYNAMRGHGGINACVVRPGHIRLLDEVAIIP